MKYIVVTTLTDNKEVAQKIINTLLDKKLVASSHLTTVKSKYWWKGKREECIEYKLEFRTKESMFNRIESEIKKIHNYDVCEISSQKITNASKEFLSWIDESIQK